MTIEQCMIAYGNLGEGFTFVGPFDDFDAAVEYGEQSERHLDLGTASEWWVATLTLPEGGVPTFKIVTDTGLVAARGFDSVDAAQAWIDKYGTIQVGNLTIKETK